MKGENEINEGLAWTSWVTIGAGVTMASTLIAHAISSNDKDIKQESQLNKQITECNEQTERLKEANEKSE